MSEPRRKRELARADHVLPGVWRLRLPLPWPGVPHVNAFAIASGSGIVLVDTGMHEPGALGQLERALALAGLRMEHVRLLVCTHAHSDHYGLAKPIVEAAGCELWMHPNHRHMTAAAENPERMLERRIEVAAHSGVPAAALESYRERRSGEGVGIAGVVEPDRDLLPGVEVDSDLGRWQVYETPGHAPSHVVLHQPDKRLLLSGDHIIGRVSLYYDFGYTRDPAGEYLSSLDTVEDLDVHLVLAGHGKPVRGLKRLVHANRSAVHERMGRVRDAIAAEALTPFEIVPKLMGATELTPMMVNWGLSETLCYLRHLELEGQAEKLPDTDPERWRLSGIKGVSGFLSFPNPVNEKAARTVAGLVLATCVVALTAAQHWLLAPLALGFLARVLTGPRLSPFGLLATKVIAPRLGDPHYVPGPPKRFAQAIGLAMTLAGTVLFLLGLEGAAAAVLVAMIVATGLESIFAVCLGCKAFSALMRLGLVPAKVCAECANFGARPAPSR